MRLLEKLHFKRCLLLCRGRGGKLLCFGVVEGTSESPRNEIGLVDLGMEDIVYGTLTYSYGT